MNHIEHAFFRTPVATPILTLQHYCCTADSLLLATSDVFEGSRPCNKARACFHNCACFPPSGRCDVFQYELQVASGPEALHRSLNPIHHTWVSVGSTFVVAVERASQIFVTMPPMPKACLWPLP